MREFAVRLNKEYRHTISDNEMIYCGRLQVEIKQRLDQDNKVSIQQKCAIVAMPSIEGIAPIYKSNHIEEVKQKPPEKILSLKQEAILPRAEIKPEQIITLLQEEKIFNFKKMYNLFNSLPHCTGRAKDTFWDNVPANDISRIIQRLTQIIAELTAPSNSKSPRDRACAFAMALMAYDIAAQLAPRYPDQFGDHFQLGNRYAFGLDDVYSEQNFFTDPIAYHTVKRIARNFEQRCQGKERILSNAVNYKNNQYDQTVHYIIRVILNDEQRDAVTQSLMKTLNIDSGKFTDEQLFGHLMENIKMKTDKGFVLDPQVAAFISLSGTAHSLGKFSETYKQNKDKSLWLYNENQFHHEMARQKILISKEQVIAKHFPRIESDAKSVIHQDFSENTLYHPLDSLTETQEKFKHRSPEIGRDYEYSPLVQLQPYQIYPSGSLRPESTIWEAKSGYEELDEDFRHIECTPNLQISRVFTWARTHLTELCNADIRVRINELLFQYGKLENGYVNQLVPTLMNMERFFAALLEYCRNEASKDNDLLIWASTLANDLRYHLEVTAKLYNLSVDQASLPRFRELLLERILITQDNEVKSSLASAVVSGFRNTSPLTLDDCCILLTSRMIANLGDDAAASDDTWENLIAEIANTLKRNERQITTILNRLLPPYLKLKSVTQWKIIDSQLIADGTDFFIDLASGSLKKSGMSDLKECTEKIMGENKKLFDRFHLTQQDITLLASSREISKASDGRWEFSHTSIHNRNIDNVYQYLAVEGIQRKFKMLQLKDLKNLFKDMRNPFESAAFYDSNYQYWQSVDDPDLLFIRQEESDYAYIYTLKSGVISQLTENQNHEWQRNGKLLLNLTRGSAAVKTESKEEKSTKPVDATELEKQWAKRLEPLFGVDNVRCIAVLSDDKKTCRIQRIEHLALGLHFTVNNKKRLMCDEFPGYALSEQLGLEVLHGLPSIIILENQHGEKKYILPAFSLKQGEKNNAFNHEAIVDTGNLCNRSQPYYLLTLNRHQELVGESVDTNLYLAILYRSLGNFKRAFHYLDCCKSAANIIASTAAIALQVLNRKIKSPMGAAFDLKLECYLKEHQQKWSRDSQQIFEPVRFSNDWHKWIKEQLQFYKNTFSNYKTGVAILPSYCRLTEEEFQWLGQESIEKKEDQRSSAESSNNIGERLAKASRLPELIFEATSSALAETYTKFRKRTSLVYQGGVASYILNLAIICEQ